MAWQWHGGQQKAWAEMLCRGCTSRTGFGCRKGQACPLGHECRNLRPRPLATTLGHTSACVRTAAQPLPSYQATDPSGAGVTDFGQTSFPTQKARSVRTSVPWTPPVQSHPACGGPPLPQGERLPSDGSQMERLPRDGTATMTEHWTAQKTNGNHCLFVLVQTTMSRLSLHSVGCPRKLLRLSMCRDLVSHGLNLKLLGPRHFTLNS